MTQTPLISIITPAFKSEAFIGETIASVLAQDYPHFELIIINDGSPDNLEKVVLEYQQKDARISYHSQANQGMCATRNNALSFAKGDYLAFLDNDDLWAPDNLSRKIKFLEEHPECALVHSDTEIIDGLGHKTGQFLRGKAGWIFEDLLTWNGTCIPSPGSILVRSAIHHEVGGFDPKLSIAGDKDYFMRIARNYQVGRIPEVTWYYRVHGNNFHKNIEVMEQDERYLLAKNLASGSYSSHSFYRQCRSNTLMILGKSWWKDGGRPLRGAKILLESIWVYPKNIAKLF